MIRQGILHKSVKKIFWHIAFFQAYLRQIKSVTEDIDGFDAIEGKRNLLSIIVVVFDLLTHGVGDDQLIKSDDSILVVIT